MFALMPFVAPCCLWYFYCSVLWNMNEMSIDLRRIPMKLIIASKAKNTDSKATTAYCDDIPKRFSYSRYAGCVFQNMR